jgi:hypothetical protein
VYACSEEKAQDAIFYSYTKYINGFAATLEEEDAMEISSTPVFFFFVPCLLAFSVPCGFLGAGFDFDFLCLSGACSPQSTRA